MSATVRASSSSRPLICSVIAMISASRLRIVVLHQLSEALHKDLDLPRLSHRFIGQGADLLDRPVCQTVNLVDTERLNCRPRLCFLGQLFSAFGAHRCLLGRSPAREGSASRWW